MMLLRAAQTPVVAGDPMARTREINAAIDKARRMYPQHFREAGDAAHDRSE